MFSLVCVILFTGEGEGSPTLDHQLSIYCPLLQPPSAFGDIGQIVVGVLEWFGVYPLGNPRSATDGAQLLT